MPATATKSLQHTTTRLHNTVTQASAATWLQPGCCCRKQGWAGGCCLGPSCWHTGTRSNSTGAHSLSCPTHIPCVATRHATQNNNTPRTRVCVLLNRKARHSCPLIYPAGLPTGHATQTAADPHACMCAAEPQSSLFLPTHISSWTTNQTCNSNSRAPKRMHVCCGTRSKGRLLQHPAQRGTHEGVLALHLIQTQTT